MGVYIVYQKEGSKAAVSRALREAIKNKDYKLARSIYRVNIGKLPEHLEDIENNFCWWQYNAGTNIITNHGVTVAQVKKRAGYKIPFGKKYAEIEVQLATEKHGGEWDWYWEY